MVHRYVLVCSSVCMYYRGMFEGNHQYVPGMWGVNLQIICDPVELVVLICECIGDR